MKVLIVEDNILNAWDYEIILDELSVQVQGICKSWKQALQIIKKEIPDFLIVDLFLDNNEDTFMFLDQIKKYFIPTIICTGFPEKEYLDKALSVGVKTFLSKPIDKASLTFHIKKLIKEINQSKEENYITIKEKSNLIRVPHNEIYKIEIERNYSSIFLESKNKYVLRLSLKKLMEGLNEEKFMRCHRSTIVNIDFINSIDVLNNKIKLSNNENIELGNKFKAQIKNAFSNNNS